MFREIVSYIALICFVACISCSFTTFQSPETVKPGNIVFGLGFGGGFAQLEEEVSPILETNLYMRLGLARNLDFGLRNISAYGFAGDLKYQFLQEPNVAFSFGASYMSVPHLDLHSGPPSVEETDRYFVVYPVLLVGEEKLYGGLRCTYWSERCHGIWYSGTRTYNTFLPGIMVGAAVGKRFKIMPELNFCLVFSNKEVPTGFVLMAGLGFQL
jgi:hypothetical protein